MTDRPHPDLDAPLSAEEADERDRVTDDEDRRRQIAFEAYTSKLPADPSTFRAGWIAGRDYRDAEIRRLRAATAELLAAIEAYDVGRYKTGREGRVGMLLRGFRETDARPNDLWWSDAVRVWKAVAALAGGTDTSDGR